MAVNYTFLDQAGVSTLTTALLKQVNVKINDRAVTAIDASSDAYHFLTAAALYALVGATDASDTTINGRINALKTLVSTNTDATADDGSVFGAIKGILADVGTSADGADAETVYGAIKKLDTKVSGLTHLTVQTYTGKITEMPADQIKSDVLYFVRDNEDDKTWELYVATNITDAGATVTWVNVGDTSVDLANYYKHDEITKMEDAAITAAVAAAYTASKDPTVTA